MKRKISILLSALLMMQLFTFENPRVYADVETETNTIKVVTAFPEDTYTEVPVSTPIYLEFDREVSAGPGIANVTLKNASGQTVAMDYLIEGKEVVFYQTGSGLQYTSAYTINIPKDAIVDAEGNYMEADYVARFTTDQEYTVLAGANRYETSLKISQKGWKDGSDYAVLATGANFPDALAGSALAGLAIAPVILVEPNMPQNVINEFRHAKDYMNHKFLLGGDSVVPRKTVEKITK